MPERATTMQVKGYLAPASVRLVKPADLSKRIQKLYDSIARRAFEIFENNGRVPGRELDDWLRAESELLHPMHIHLTESNEGFTVRAEVPGFKAEELEVSLDGSRLTITGKRESRAEWRDQRAILREHCSDQVLRAIDLPAPVDAERVNATLQDGVLTLEIPKAEPASQTNVETRSR
jgi:HSP20 family protein